MVISRFQQLRLQFQGLTPVPAVVAAAQDLHTLEGVFAAQEDGLIEPILVGDPEQIRAAAQKLGRSLPSRSIVKAEGEADCAARAVALVRSGEGKLLIKGMLQTGTLLKAVVDHETGIRASQVMSHTAILEVPAYHKLLFVTDGGMVVAPDLDTKRHILRNSLELCRRLGYTRPKAAILCAVEVVNPHMVETLDAEVLAGEANAGAFGPCDAAGPISFDLATNPESARIKKYESPVAGDADILLVPSIAAGNLMSKALYGMAGGTMAGVVLGGSVPITINSRGATPEEKYSSILVSAAMSATDV